MKTEEIMAEYFVFGRYTPRRRGVVHDLHNKGVLKRDGSTIERLYIIPDGCVQSTVEVHKRLFQALFKGRPPQNEQILIKRVKEEVEQKNSNLVWFESSVPFTPEEYSGPKVQWRVIGIIDHRH